MNCHGPNSKWGSRHAPQSSCEHLTILRIVLCEPQVFVCPGALFLLLPEMQQNPDLRPLTPGCATHFDAQRQQWYYVHLETIPPRVSYIHPSDETPLNPQSPVRGTSPHHHQQQQQQTTNPSVRYMSAQQPSRPTSESANFMPNSIQNRTVQQQPSYGNRQQQQQNTHAPFRHTVPSPPQQPSSPTSDFNIQNPTVQQRLSYGNMSSGQSTSPVEDYYPSRQQQNSSTAPVNIINPSPFTMHHARQPSEAQSIYSTSFPQTMQTPSDQSRFSIYSTNSSDFNSQETEFDASTLYTSPVSLSPTSAPVNSPVAVSPILQPKRRQVMSLDGSESFTSSPSNQATNHPRPRSVQATPAAPMAQRMQQPNILRRKAKTALAAASGNTPKPVQPTPTYQRPNDVPVYNLVAQAPLNPAIKPTTPSFQSLLYSKPPLPPALPDPSNNSCGALQPITQVQTRAAAPSHQAALESAMMQGLLNSQFPSSMQPNHVATQASTTTTIPQQPLSPVRAQTTGFSARTGPSHVSSLQMMNNQTPSLMHRTQSTPALTNGMVATNLNTAQFSINQMPSTSLMSTHPQPDGFLNGTNALPMGSMHLPFNQPQSLISAHTQLNGLSNGTMTLPGVSPPISPTLIPPQPQQHNSFSNEMFGYNAMAQSSLPMLSSQQPNMLSNGYASGLPFGASATPLPGGMTPGGMGNPIANNNTTAQQTAQAEPRDNNKNKQVMKKVGMSLGKAALRFGTRFALEQMGLDESIAGVAASVAVSGAAAAANAASGSNS